MGRILYERFSERCKTNVSGDWADSMEIFKTTAKLYQLFLSAVQFICKNKRIFNRVRRIALVKFA